MSRRRRGVLVVLSVALLAVTVAAACGPPKSTIKPVDTTPPTLDIQKDFVTGLNNPWDMAFLPDGTMFFTQRPGPVSVRLPNGAITNLGNPPGSAPSGEGGVMGIAVDPNFAANRYLYVCYTHTSDNRVTRFTLNPDLSPGLESPFDVVTGMPKNNNHNGCRIRFGFDAMLWITMGDAQNAGNARNLGSLSGKILRVNPGGTNVPAPGNPFGTLVITYGHRNPQGIAFRANFEVYSVEHGPGQDDEVNLLIAGGDYGWNGSDMTCCGGIEAVWSSGDPTIAPSGATFVYGTQWKGWNGALILAVLKDMRFQVFVERNGALQFGAPVIIPTGVRMRSVVQGPDGNLYAATDVGGGNGAIWRITPS